MKTTLAGGTGQKRGFDNSCLRVSFSGLFILFLVVRISNNNKQDMLFVHLFNDNTQ